MSGIRIQTFIMGGVELGLPSGVRGQGCRRQARDPCGEREVFDSTPKAMRLRRGGLNQNVREASLKAMAPMMRVLGDPGDHDRNHSRGC